MKAYRLPFIVLCLSILLAGCQTENKKTAGTPADPLDEEGKIQANLAKLSPEDRKLAEGQKFCAVENENRLGSMGKPIKVLVKDEPVFLCCRNCKEKALADPDKTLATVKELKAKAGKESAK